MTSPSPGVRLAPTLTPHGRLLLAASDDAPELEPALAERIRRAFERGAGHGLLHLGAAEVGQALPPALAYWRELGGRFVTAVCASREGDDRRVAVPPPPDDLAALAAAAPPMTGAEYLTAGVLTALWGAIGEAFHAELAEARTTVQDFLKRRNPAWNLVGRVHFNLAENRKDAEAPFAFLATYTDAAVGARQGAAPAARPGAARVRRRGQQGRLLSLLLPVQRAAEHCAWLRRWSTRARSSTRCAGRRRRRSGCCATCRSSRRAGVIVRMPAAWRAGRPPRPQVTATVGAQDALARSARTRCSTSAWR